MPRSERVRYVVARFYIPFTPGCWGVVDVIDSRVVFVDPNWRREDAESAITRLVHGIPLEVADA